MNLTIPIIEVYSLNKKYNLYHSSPRLLRDQLNSLLQKPFTWWVKETKDVTPNINSETEFWSLKNISLTIKRGETVGIIGPNGAGKSTLLKILAGVTTPTTGHVKVRGSIGSLLEIGAGFQSELTGRENVYLTGAILGIKQSHIREKFSEIHAFSGVGKFIDTPVKFYSSGMYLRLAFAVAVQLNTEILLVDEVLSIGDAEFQEKSFQKMESLSRTDNRTIVFVSHDMNSIRRLCDRVYLLKDGQIIESGGALDVTTEYLADTLTVKKMHRRDSFHRGNLHLVLNHPPTSGTLEKTEVFERPEALIINKARLDHLKSLGIQYTDKFVLDVGCGVGKFSQYFISQKADVTCIDGREENLKVLKKRLPVLKHKSWLADVESDNLSKLGLFDIVFCYGLLYHTEKPELILEKLSQICRELLLLECCITDHPEPLNLWVEETNAYNQALHGIGSRPTPSYLISALHQAGFSYIYFPKRPPQHPDFQFKYQGDLAHTRGGKLLRQVFVAAKSEIINPNLHLISLHIAPQKTSAKQTTTRFKVNLIKTNSKSLVNLLQTAYQPQPLLPIPGWSLGKLEYMRQPLVDLWVHFSARNLSRPLIINWYNQIRLRLYPVNEICRALYCEGSYEPNEIYFLNQFLQPGMTFIDVGANLGLYALFAASRIGNTGRVLAFEPSSREFRRLQAQQQLNPQLSIRSYPWAIAHSNGERNLQISDDRHAGHNTLGTFAYREVSKSKQEKVQVKSLDEVIEKNKLKLIDIIKMDIEGAEYAALSGARSTLKYFKPLLLLELSDLTLYRQGSSSKQIHDLLQELQYVIYQFHYESGLLVRASRQSDYQSENILAVPGSKIKLLPQVCLN